MIALPLQLFPVIHIVAYSNLCVRYCACAEVKVHHYTRQSSQETCTALVGALFCSGRLGYKNTLGMNWTKAVVGPFVTQVSGLCGRTYGCQSDMLGFVVVRLSV